MKILLINGSPHEQGCTYTALNEVRKTLNAEGIETELRQIGVQPIAGCIACGKCKISGHCIFADQVNEILDELDSIDGMVFGSPVYYAGAAGQLCCFLDRLFYAGGSRMVGKLGASVVSCRRGGATAAFDRLNKYFGISNMITVGSQYWNQIHGNTPQEAAKDQEGLQTMRSLGQNMAWLLKSKEKAALPLPVYEKKTFTNFIN